MNETHLRDIVVKGLPKIAATAAAIYPVGFQPSMETSRDRMLDNPVVSSQLVYTKKTQILSFLILDPAQIVKLGQWAFPKYSRQESPKMVLSANGEVLNSVMSKLGYLIGKLDDETDVSITPPLILNCSGAGCLPIRGEESLCLKLAAKDVSMLLIVAFQVI